MREATIRDLRRVKQIRADRAETARRTRAAALAAAVAAIETARTTHAAWRDSIPARTHGIYAPVMGRAVSQEQLAVAREKVGALRMQEQMLAKRIGECERSAQEARALLAEAEAKAAATRRAVSKFDEIAATFRRAAVFAAERREEAELDEAAESRQRREDSDGNCAA